MLGPERAADALAERAGRLDALIADNQQRLDEALASGSVPRLFVIEAEYALAMLRAERDWVLALADDITSGRLAWPRPPRQDREGKSVKHSTPGALTFGIYPGSAVGDTGPAGPPDRPDQINEALGQLQGLPGRPFTVRAYDLYADPGDTAHASLAADSG